MTKNLVLIGMPGTFKSSSGSLAAKMLNADFIDTDELIEAQCGLSIPDIFKRYGEDYFRNVESDIIKECAKMKGVVISCGGGAVLREGNMTALKENGIVVLLTASVEEIYRRVSEKSNRPLLGATPDLEKLKSLFLLRKPIYERYCDKAVDNTKLSSEKTAGVLVEIVCQDLKNSI